MINISFFLEFVALFALYVFSPRFSVFEFHSAIILHTYLQALLLFSNLALVSIHSLF
jgi:hypothetical protein